MEQNLITVACNNCGAPLEVAESTRFVTCRYCSSQLEIHCSEGAAYTKVLKALEARTEQIEANTQQLAEEVQTIRFQHELEEIDREWEMQKEQYYVTDEKGRKSLPTKGGSAVGALVIVVVGVVFISIAAGMGSGLFVVVAVLVIGAGIATAVANMGKADRYEQAKQRYEAKRARVLEELRRRGVPNRE